VSAPSAPSAQKLGQPLAVARHVAHVPPVERPARVGSPRGRVCPVPFDLGPKLLQEGEDCLVGGVVGGGCGLARHGDDNMGRVLAGSKAIRRSDGVVA